MSGNSFGKLFTVTTFGESHGIAIGGVVDGCPPGLEITEEDLQVDLDRRKPGTSRYTTARREDDEVQILSGVFEGKTTGTSIGLLIKNKDQRSQDYGNIKDRFRPGHADYTYDQKKSSYSENISNFQEKNIFFAVKKMEHLGHLKSMGHLGHLTKLT